RSSGDQATLCVDGWLQVVQERGHHDCRHRARPSYSQGAILFRSWPSAPWLVAQSGMGDGTRIRERLETQKTSARPKYPALHQSQIKSMGLAFNIVSGAWLNPRRNTP